MAQKSNRFKPTFRSKAEKEIFNILKDYTCPLAQMYDNYPYSEFTATTNEKLRADIYIKTFSFVIEYDGEFHYNPINFGTGDVDKVKANDIYEEVKKHDKLKERLCNDAEIKMIRISCFEWKKLKTLDEKIHYLYEKVYE